MKKISQILRNHNKKLAIGGALLFFSSSSFADLPGGVAPAFATLRSDGIALVDLAWTVAVPVTVAFIILKMFRRAASSAT